MGQHIPLDVSEHNSAQAIVTQESLVSISKIADATGCWIRRRTGNKYSSSDLAVPETLKCGCSYF